MPQIMPNRVTKKPLLALAAITIAVIAVLASGRARPAAADAGCTTSCTVQVEFQTIKFPKLDDCTWGAPCDPLERSIQAYGGFTARTWKAGVFGPAKRLKLASWGDQPGFCPGGGVAWGDSLVGRAECYRSVRQHNYDLEPPYYLSQTFLCAASANSLCAGGWAKNNNRVTLTVKPGDVIMVGATIKDYDSGSPDDIVCNPSAWVGPFTAQQLASLNTSPPPMQTAFNGDGACMVTYSVKRVG